jgi:hypothetical protein
VRGLDANSGTRPDETGQELAVSQLNPLLMAKAQRKRAVGPECAQNTVGRVPEGCEGALTRQKGSCDASHETFEAEDVEDAGKVVAERHQAPFTANFVEAPNKEVPIAGAAFDSAEGMFDDGGSSAHQLVRALHARPMTFENILVFPAIDDALRGILAETA